MKVEQLYPLINTITQESLGDSVVVNEDLSNIVDVGDAILGAMGVDNYVKALVDRIGKVIFVSRVYAGSVPSVMRSDWDFGSILEKIDCEMPDAIQVNDTWDLQNNASYDPFVFRGATISAKFFNEKVTFEVDISIAKRQVEESFVNAQQLNTFVEMIYTAVENSMTIKIDGLIMRGLNTMIAETMYDEFNATSSFSLVTGVKAINLLKLYNDRFSTSLTQADCVTDKDFIKFASYMIGLTTSRLAKMSKLFNIDGKARFTPAEELSLVLHADFWNASKAYLYSDTFHDEFVKLPDAEVVPYWQGSDNDYAFADTSKIMCTTPSGHTMTITGVIGLAFDRRGIACCNYRRDTESIYNPRGQFFNNFFKFDCHLIVDTSENAVVFFAE